MKAKTYRIRATEAEALKSLRIQWFTENGEEIKESEILHTLIKRHLKKLTLKETLDSRNQ